MLMKTKSKATKRGYGWQPDLPDMRDHQYSAPVALLGKLPPKVDLRPKCPPVLDQGQLGSCTANAIGNAHLFSQKKEGKKKPFTPSRLFIYYNERAMEGTINSDAGAQIRDGIKSIAKLGVCPETELPYDITKFTQKPSAKCFSDGLKNQALSYQRLVQTLSQLKGCLASGFPFVFGFTVYDSFESDTVAKTGVAPMPSGGEKVLGGHAVLAVGYDDPSQRFIVMNSWSTGWGQKGYFTIPYAYLTDDNLSADFWTVRLVE
jgi:C1A family cysteine protease